jgi:DNA-directed RNA polymerase I subunit RPA49
MAEKDGKKRKRQSNGAPAPSKKPHIDGTAKVEVSENGMPPVIASAPGLAVPPISFKAYSKASSRAKDNSLPKPETHNIPTSRKPRIMSPFTTPRPRNCRSCPHTTSASGVRCARKTRQ